MMQSAPRTRGDGPVLDSVPKTFSPCSPHPRGWSRRPGEGHRDRWLLPAPAGMVPDLPVRGDDVATAPRTRGDGPWLTEMGRLGGDCSPHPRGWSLGTGVLYTKDALLPAPAGMVPCALRWRTAVATAPRTRVDGPYGRLLGTITTSCSPHPRGWSLHRAVRRNQPVLLPAPAGMVPRRTTRSSSGSTAPRTRGDGPPTARQKGPILCCSPHPRGWSHGMATSGTIQMLLPAPAGMVPSWRSCTRARATAPRTRGDGPWSKAYLRGIYCRSRQCLPCCDVTRRPVAVPGGTWPSRWLGGRTSTCTRDRR